RRDAASGGRRSKRRGRADGGSRSGGAKHAVLEFRLSGLLATPGNVAIGDEQYDEAAQQSEIERVVEEFVDDARFGYRGALLRLGLRRFGLLRVRARRCGLGGGGRWRGDRLGGLGCGGLGRFDGRLGGFRRRRGLRDRRGRGRGGGRSRRRRRLGRGLPLQFGKLLVLHLQQLAQVARVLLQVGLARLRFRERALARHRIVVTRSLRTRTGLGGLGFRKSQLVLPERRRRGGLGLDTPSVGLLAGGRFRGGRRRRQTAAVLGELRHVLLDDPIGLGAIDGAHRVRIRDVQDAALAHQVDVLADERAFIRAVEREQHLVQRHAWRQIGARDLAQRVAPLNLVNHRLARHPRAFAGS